MSEPTAAEIEMAWNIIYRIVPNEVKENDQDYIGDACFIAQALHFHAEETRKEAEKDAEELIEFMVHDQDCIRSHCSAGEPTVGGGYRQKFHGKWYQSVPIDETPKCNCGLDKALTSYRLKHPEGE